MTEPITAEPVGVHRTFLAADGSGKASVTSAKMMLGCAGIIRLVADDEVTTGLGLAEGIETALAVMQGFGWHPVWAATSAGQMRTFPVLPAIEILTLFADADGAGLNAAQHCAETWTEAGREARIIAPPAGEDFNDTARRCAAFFTVNALDFAYHANAPEPVHWLAFLKQILPDDQQAIDALQEFFGLALTGDTRHQKAFLIVGPKRSGKGTVARVLTQLLGQANVCGPTLSGLGQNFGLEPLIGKRLAIVSDARLGGKIDQHVIVERILAITGEDSLTVDRKFRTAWTGKLETRFLILSNELPRLTDASGALASRFIILRLTHSFFGKEDLGLTARLTVELPGILCWALEGWDRLAKRGHFIPPASSRAAQEQLEDLGSPIGAFLRDRCSIGPGEQVVTEILYHDWCDWCREQGRDHPGTVQTFGRDLGTAVPGLKIVQPRTDNGRQREYEGIGLKPLARSGTRV